MISGWELLGFCLLFQKSEKTRTKIPKARDQEKEKENKCITRRETKKPETVQEDQKNNNTKRKKENHNQREKHHTQRTH